MPRKSEEQRILDKWLAKREFGLKKESPEQINNTHSRRQRNDRKRRKVEYVLAWRERHPATWKRKHRLAQRRYRAKMKIASESSVLNG